MKKIIISIYLTLFVISGCQTINETLISRNPNFQSRMFLPSEHCAAGNCKDGKGVALQRISRDSWRIGYRGQTNRSLEEVFVYMGDFSNGGNRLNGKVYRRLVLIQRNGSSSEAHDPETFKRRPLPMVESGYGKDELVFVGEMEAVVSEFGDINGFKSPDGETGKMYPFPGSPEAADVAYGSGKAKSLLFSGWKYRETLQKASKNRLNSKALENIYKEESKENLVLLREHRVLSASCKGLVFRRSPDRLVCGDKTLAPAKIAGEDMKVGLYFVEPEGLVYATPAAINSLHKYTRWPVFELDASWHKRMKHTCSLCKGKGYRMGTKSNTIKLAPIYKTSNGITTKTTKSTTYTRPDYQGKCAQCGGTGTVMSKWAKGE